MEPYRHALGRTHSRRLHLQPLALVLAPVQVPAQLALAPTRIRTSSTAARPPRHGDAVVLPLDLALRLVECRSLRMVLRRAGSPLAASHPVAPARGPRALADSHRVRRALASRALIRVKTELLPIARRRQEPNPVVLLPQRRPQNPSRSRSRI